MAVSEILKDIQQAMLSSIEDGNGEGEWRIEKDYISVTTAFSRDPSRSNNGGEYYYYRRYRIVEGGIRAWDDWSCDIADYSQYGGGDDFYPIAVSDLGRIGNLAEARALAERNKQAQPACPFCGGTLEEVCAQIDDNAELREAVARFLERKIGFKELKDALD